MYPPKITTTERNNLVGVTNGAMIYNTSGDQLQIYIDGWVGIQTYIDTHGTLRVKTETLVAMSSIDSDASDDTKFPDS